jgi:hypothetical protein
MPPLPLRNQHGVAASYDDAASSAFPSARSSVEFAAGGRLDPNLSVISGHSGASHVMDVDGMLERCARMYMVK